MISLKQILSEQKTIRLSQQKLDNNINKLLQEQRKDNLNENWIDNIQYVADFAGFIPVYGDIIDAINAIIYFLRGKPLQGFLSIIAMIPLVGSIVAVPFKVLFKVLGAVAVPLMRIAGKLLKAGKGDVFAKKLIDVCVKNGKISELTSVVNTVKKYNSQILNSLRPITSKFEALHNFNHMLVPNFVEKSINKLGVTGSGYTKGLIKFFEELGSTTPAKIKSLSADIPSELPLNKLAGPLAKKADLVKQIPYQPKSGDPSVISTYVDKTGKPRIWIASPKTGADLSTSQIILKRKPGTNEISMVANVSAQPKGYFKDAMTKLSTELPAHKFYEGESISTDGLLMWGNFVKNGYKPLTAKIETFTVPINSVGQKIEFKNSFEFGEGNFKNIGFKNKIDADNAKKRMDKELKKLRLPNASVKIAEKKGIPGLPEIPGKIKARPGTPSTFYLEITLPKLQSTRKSINYYKNIAGTKAVAKTTQQAVKEKE